MDLGPMEIFLIVMAVVLLFGVGKLGNIGGALGKSIREFRKERDRVDDAPQLAVKEINKEKTSLIETKSDNL